jgi:hypothetical protein
MNDGGLGEDRGEDLTRSAGVGSTELDELTYELEEGIPSRPLLGVLPLKRFIPQDLHSLLDYSGGLTLVASGLLCSDPAGRMAGLMLGTSGAVVSALTDYRLSLAKLIPIEVHEALDYVVGFGAIAAPFLFGYRGDRRRRGNTTSIVQMAVGLTIVVGSLFTDYRARYGRGRR